MRTKKAIINIIIMIIFEAVTMICGLILPRYILSAFGSEYNGIISSITQFVNFISILNVGIPGATRVALYKTLAANDIEATSSVLKATDLYVKKLSKFFIFYLISLAFVFPFLSHSSYPFVEIFTLTIIIGLGTFANYFFGITYQILLSADQTQYIFYLIQAIATVLNTLISIGLIKIGASIHTVEFSSAVLFFITPIILNCYVSKKYKINKKSSPNINALNQRFDAFALGIANVIHNNTDILVLTVFTDPKVVSVYTIYNLVVAGLRKILTVFTTGIEAAFGNMFAKGEQDSINKNLDIFEHFIYSFITVVLSCAFPLIIPFVKLYTDGIIDAEYVIPVYGFLTILSVAIYAIRIPYMTIVQAAGHYKQTRNGSFVEAGLNIVISIVCVFKLGIIGVVIGTIIADAYRTVQYGLYISKNLIDKPFVKILKRMFWLFGNTVLSSFICNIALKGLEISNWANWIFSGFICFGISVFIVVLSSFLFYRNNLMAEVKKLALIIGLKK